MVFALALPNSDLKTDEPNIVAQKLMSRAPLLAILIFPLSLAPFCQHAAKVGVFKAGVFASFFFCKGASSGGVRSFGGVFSKVAGWRCWLAQVPVFTTGNPGVPSQRVRYEAKQRVYSSVTGEEMPTRAPKMGDFLGWGSDRKPRYAHGAIRLADGTIMVHRPTAFG